MVGPRVVRALSGQLGSGPWAVRSAAPAEDAEIDSIGRYTSVLDVDAATLAEAVTKVVASYDREQPEDTARADGRRRCVLIQPMVRASWAGVARRTSAARGGVVLVEGSPGSNVGITSGEQPGIVAPIGPVSRRWLGGGLDEAGLSASAFLAAFDRIEAALGSDCEIEWAWTDAGLVALQARTLPSLDTAAAPAEVVELWQEIGPALAAGPAERIVLDRGPLVDLASPPSRATVSLLDDIWRESSVAATRVVRLGGVAWFLHEPERPIDASVRGPVQRVGRVASRVTADRDIGALISRLTDLEATLPVAPLPAGDATKLAAELLDRRRSLLDGPGEVARRASELAGVGSARTAEVLGDGVKGDSLMSALAGTDQDDSEDMTRRSSFRGRPDLSLEVPRIGEGRFEMEPPSFTGAEPSGDLRGRARVVLAWHAWRLREALLALADATGRDDVFEWSVPEIEQLAATGEPPAARSSGVDAPKSAMPSQLDVAGLESWVATGHPTRSVHRDDDLVRLGAPSAWEGVLGAVGETRDGAIRLSVPEPSVIARLDPDCRLLVAHGAELCHGALLARARGMTGLMGLGAELLELPVGTRLRIEPDGSWSLPDDPDAP